MDTIYWYAKDTYEAKHQLLINKRESTELKHLNDSKAFIKYLSYMVDVYKTLKNTIKMKNLKYWLFLMI